MSISQEVREQVRRRAFFACEYCGVKEEDAGGELTLDHFQPVTHGGSDLLDNLLYCCVRCNIYKADYWPVRPGEPALWNPRVESRETHFIQLANGTLYPVTDLGGFTLHRLRLNRPPLVEYRLRRRNQSEELSILTRYEALVGLIEQLQQQLAELLNEHRVLLEEQRELLKLLLRQ